MHAALGAIIAISIIGVSLFGLNQAGILQFNDGQKATTPDTEPLTTFEPNTTLQVYTGKYTLGDRISNALDPAEDFNDNNDLSLIAYDRLGTNAWSDIATWATNTTDINVKESRAEMWIEFTIKNLKDLLLSVDDTKIANDRLGVFTYGDANGDGKDMFIAPYNLIGISKGIPNPATTPSDTLYVKVFREGTLDIDSPADITAIGQGTVEKTMKWSADMKTALAGTEVDARAAAVTEIKLTFNSTEVRDWSEDGTWIEVPNPVGDGMTKIKLNDAKYVTRSDLASSTVYKIKFGSEQNDANYFIVANSGEPQIETPIHVTSTFDADDECFSIAYQIEQINAQSVYRTDSDTAVFWEGSSGDCTT